MAAGQSVAPLAKKLGIAENSSVFLSDVPKDYLKLIAPVPRGARVVNTIDETTYTPTVTPLLLTSPPPFLLGSRQPFLLDPLLDEVGDLRVIRIRHYPVRVSEHTLLRKIQIHGVAAILVDCRCHELEALSSDAESWLGGTGRVNLTWNVVAPDDQLGILGELDELLQRNARTIRSGDQRTVSTLDHRLFAFRKECVRRLKGDMARDFVGLQADTETAHATRRMAKDDRLAPAFRVNVFEQDGETSGFDLHVRLPVELGILGAEVLVQRLRIS